MVVYEEEPVATSLLATDLEQCFCSSDALVFYLF